jgi:MFS family permease
MRVKLIIIALRKRLHILDLQVLPLKLFKIQLSNPLHRNYLLNVLDGGFFGLAMGFASFTTVIPLFLNTLTHSALLIGLIPAIRSMGYQLPPLFMAGSVSRQKYFKPMILRNTIHERIPFLFLALIAWFSPQLGRETSVLLVFICIIWQGLGGGITANPLQNLVARIFPSQVRGTVIGAQSAANNLFSSGSALVGGIVLTALPVPYNYAACFLIASFWLASSYLCLANLKEPQQAEDDIYQAPPPVKERILGILKEDAPFRSFVATKMLAQFAMLASAFYMIYAVRHLAMDTTTAGIMTGVLFITQVVANPVIGYISDRWSRKGVLEIGGVALILGPLLAWLAPGLGWYYLVIVLAGIANTIFMTMGLAFLLEFGNDGDRPTYFGLANTLTAPVAVLAPLLGGWLADTAGFQGTFLIAGLAGFFTLLVTHFFVVDPRHAATAI